MRLSTFLPVRNDACAATRTSLTIGRWALCAKARQHGAPPRFVRGGVVPQQSALRRRGTRAQAGKSRVGGLRSTGTRSPGWLLKSALWTRRRGLGFVDSVEQLVPVRQVGPQRVTCAGRIASPRSGVCHAQDLPRRRAHSRRPRHGAAPGKSRRETGLGPRPRLRASDVDDAATRQTGRLCRRNRRNA